MQTYSTECGRGATLVAGYQETLRVAFGAADLVLTSPPYDDARTYGAGVSWTLHDYRELGDAVWGALKPGGHCILVIDSPVREWRKGVGTERGFTPWRVMLDWAERVGFRVPDRLAYGRQGMPGAYAGRFRNDWEPMLWFQKPGARGFFDRWPLTEKAKYGIRRGRASSRRADGTMYARQASGRAVDEGVTHRGTLWDYGNVGAGRNGALEKQGHPARFPLALADDVVRCFCPPGGLVVDPMVGSGTTLVAALRNGRVFLGGDLFFAPDGRPWAEVAVAVANEMVHPQEAPDA